MNLREKRVKKENIYRLSHKKHHRPLGGASAGCAPLPGPASVSGIRLFFITIDEQIQYNRCCFSHAESAF